MTTPQALRILQLYSRWRKGSPIICPKPIEITLALDHAVKILQVFDEKTSP